MRTSVTCPVHWMVSTVSCDSHSAGTDRQTHLEDHDGSEWLANPTEHRFHLSDTDWSGGTNQSIKQAASSSLCSDWVQPHTREASLQQKKTSTALRWLHVTLQPSAMMRRSLLAHIRITLFIVSVHFSASHLSEFVECSCRAQRLSRLILAAQKPENSHRPLRRTAGRAKSLENICHHLEQSHFPPECHTINHFLQKTQKQRQLATSATDQRHAVMLILVYTGLGSPIDVFGCSFLKKSKMTQAGKWQRFGGKQIWNWWWWQHPQGGKNQWRSSRLHRHQVVCLTQECEHWCGAAGHILPEVTSGNVKWQKEKSPATKGLEPSRSLMSSQTFWKRRPSSFTQVSRFKSEKVEHRESEPTETRGYQISSRSLSLPQEFN